MILKTSMFEDTCKSQRSNNILDCNKNSEFFNDISKQLSYMSILYIFI